MGAGNFIGLLLPIIRVSTLDLRMVFSGHYCIVRPNRHGPPAA